MDEELYPSEVIKQIKAVGAECLAWSVRDEDPKATEWAVDVDVNIPDGSTVIAHDVVTILKRYVETVNPGGILSWKNLNHSTVLRFSFLDKSSEPGGYIYATPGKEMDLRERDWIQDLHDSMPKRDWDKLMRMLDKTNKRNGWWRETLKEVAICIALGTLIAIVTLVVMWFGHLVF